MNINQRIRYGAAELKSAYNKNLGAALTISIGLHLVLIGLYAFADNVGKASEAQKLKLGSRIRLVAIQTPPEAPVDEPPPIVPPELVNPAGGGGIAARAGNPIPVPDAVIPPEATAFAAVDQIALATPEGGDGTGFLPGQDVTLRPIDLGARVDVTREDREPGIDEFISDAVEPTFDQEGLQRRVRYPEIAERNGIEGTVVVRVLIDRFGKPQKYRVDLCDNKLLEQAAIDAVMSTQYTPGVQNEVVVQLWLSVPIKFELP